MSVTASTPEALGFRLRPAPDTTARAFAVALWIATIAHLFWAGWADLRRLLPCIPDDAFYFQQIARNAALGQGYTFDGIHATNGFQPLWLWMLVPMQFLCAGLSRETAFRMGLCLNVALIALACSLAFRAARRVCTPPWALMVGATCMLVGFRWGVNGMETALLLFTVIALFAYSLSIPSHWSLSPTHRFLSGVLLGLVVLARLDSIFLAAVFFAAGLVGALGAQNRRAAMIGLAYALTGTLLVVAPYLFYNRFAFGSFMPVSGQLKSSFPHPQWNQAFAHARSYGVLPLIQGALSTAYLLWYVMRLQTLRQAPHEAKQACGAVAVLAAGIVLHLIHEALFIRWASMAWHFALGGLIFPALFIAVGCLRAASETMKTGSTSWSGDLAAAFALAICAAFLLTLGAVNRFRGRAGEAWHRAAYEAALWARHETPATAVFAMKDCGLFGYFSERPTVNLDGLVNGPELQEALHNRATLAYLRSCGVKYLAQHAFLPGDPHLPWHADGGSGDLLNSDYQTLTLRYRSQRYGSLSEPLGLKREDEAHRSALFEDDGHQTRLIVWRLRYDH